MATGRDGNGDGKEKVVGPTSSTAPVMAGEEKRLPNPPLVMVVWKSLAPAMATCCHPWQLGVMVMGVGNKMRWDPSLVMEGE
jgi:hypothetical protein